MSERGVPDTVVHAFGLLKAACAQVNEQLSLLPNHLAAPIIKAAEEVASGDLDKHFVVDIYQTGSGTSSNMNANEVIANRVSQMQDKPIGSKDPVHPNDHVNAGSRPTIRFQRQCTSPRPRRYITSYCLQSRTFGQPSQKR